MSTRQRVLLDLIKNNSATNMEIQNQKKWTKDHEYLKKSLKQFLIQPTLFFWGEGGGRKSNHLLKTKIQKAAKLKLASF